MARAGVALPLHDNAILDHRAQARAEQLCDAHLFSHWGWQNSFKWLSYDYHGENLAEGSGDMNTVESALLNSPRHKANIVNVHYTDMGLGYDPDCQLTVELYAG